MKKIILLSIGLIIGTLSFSQYNDIAPGFKSKRDRIKIDGVMEELINRIVIEKDCEKDEIKYTVIDRYSDAYYNKIKYLPKTIIVSACNEKLTYIRVADYNTGMLRLWDQGKWVLNSTSIKNRK